MAIQWYLRVQWNKRMYTAAKSTDRYLAEVARRMREGLDPNVPIEVLGAEPPVWTDLWPIQLVLIPYRLYKWFAIDRPRFLEEQAAFMEEYDTMTSREKRKVQQRVWKAKNQ
jgi:hypothetical protein